MHQIRSRKAFTLIELIIVIVILGILAGIAIVGYQAVINRAKESKVDQAAQSFDRAFRALAAFDSNYGGAGASTTAEGILVDMAAAGDVPGIDAVRVANQDDDDKVLLSNDTDAGTAGAQPTDAAAITDTPLQVEFEEDGTLVCLTLATSANTPGTFADGACTLANMS